MPRSADGLSPPPTRPQGQDAMRRDATTRAVQRRAARTKARTSSAAAWRSAAAQLDKHYHEARINSGDRIVFRVEAGTVFVVDVAFWPAVLSRGRRLSQLENAQTAKARSTFDPGKTNLLKSRTNPIQQRPP